MPTYRITRAYQANRDGATWGPYAPDQLLDLREDDADWLNRDSPGLAVPHVEAPPEPELDPGPAQEPPTRDATPTANRQHRGTRRRSTTEA